MRQLYPPINPNKTLTLPVDDVHVLCVEESGDPRGVPVVYLHGGPGAGSNPYQRRLFNPEHYRIVVFDQRGCGQSTPHAALRDNTTDHLIADMERIRTALEIDRWVVSGGSWGATLALAYAQAFPDRVLGLIVRGIFLSTQAELDWLYGGGAGRIFPDHWAEFCAPIPDNERDDLLHAYHRRLTGSNELQRMKAAKAWALWETHLATLLPNPRANEGEVDVHQALSIARIEADYFVNHSYLKEGQLLAGMSALADIPGYIVHGRYDMVCPLEQAWKLHQAWPLSDLCIVPGAGHSASEPGITSALLRCGDAMLRRI
ncbi:MAG TPA: prolyl aminopeptidase [Gammaproteobacteria bacterium]|jgi:proline iminopeptidase|nr:prolyl aminopeptidase [Gammaproteobacteria bacterium]